eukprot:6291958-Amphidinium_carterae.1
MGMPLRGGLSPGGFGPGVPGTNLNEFLLSHGFNIGFNESSTTPTAFKVIQSSVSCGSYKITRRALSRAQQQAQRCLNVVFSSLVHCKPSR